MWLIFSLVVVWTCFPPAFAAIASTLYIPCSVAAFGVILRGSGFAFRKEVTSIASARIFGASFAVSSVITPFALGTIAGAVASSRVPSGIARGNVITSWFNPTSLIGGAIAVSVCAYLAAVLLCADCARDGDDVMARQFRNRAVAVAIMVAALGFISIPVIAHDAPRLYSGLTGPALPIIIASSVLAAVSVILLLAKRFKVVRASAGLSVVTAVWAWGIAQYPDLLPGYLKATDAAAAPATLNTVVIGLAIGAVLVIPSLVLLYSIAQRPEPS